MNVIYDEKATEFLEKLDFALKKRIIDKIEFAKENPFHFFERLVEQKTFKLRVGDYRIIADINESTIVILTVGHRKNVYDKR